MVKGSDVVLSGATYLPNDVCENKVFADDVGHVKNFKNFDKFKRLAEVSDVVNGVKPGRESDSERVLAYNIGVSIHDIYFAASIYQLFKETGKLEQMQEIDMKEPTEKFWI